MTSLVHCPLCERPDTLPYHRDRRRSYLQCTNCALVFVPPVYYLDAERERAEYDLHDNRIDDPGYRKFLSRLFVPLSQLLPVAARGLDFGCGPGPALAAMCREQGFDMALYDHFYYPDRSVLEQRYDFITATEVVEHLHRPGLELAMLWHCLKPGGHLGIMTKLLRDRAAFSTWHYKNDPTHVCFFSVATWRWWAKQVAADLSFEGADVILLHKPNS